MSEKQRSTERLLALAIFLMLGLLTIIAAVRQMQDQAVPPLASFSSAPDGAHALELWLRELGYTIHEETLPAFEPPAEADLILMLEPLPGMTEEEWAALDKWVDRGGTLVVAGYRLGSALAIRHFDFNLVWGEATTVRVQTPLFGAPPLNPPDTTTARVFLSANHTNFVTHAAAGSRPVVVSMPQGNGRVILSSIVTPFSNSGLKQPGNGALALNIISAGNDTGRGVIWFNEWHHGIRATRAAVTGPAQWLRRTPAGRSLLYTAAVIFLGLALTGQRFGRPVPVAKETRRRAPLEFIKAIANLNRRSGQRTAVLAQYHQWLKRRIGHRYRLDPALPDDVYVRQLAAYNTDLDTAALQSLLTRLRRQRVSEREMVELAAETTTWLDNA
jgi:hypothetical protein